MRRLSPFFLVVVLISLIFPFLTQKAYSGDLGALVNLRRLTVNVATGGTICATAETAAIETSLQVIFPTGMTVNSTAANWTVDTSDLPGGSTPMPGIDTASGVSGQTVTFPINDLSVGTQYCFNFSGTNTLTTPSSTGTYTGTLRTRNGANATIDTRAYAIPVVQNDRITVTATVPANPTDFEAVLTSSNGTSSVRENTEITYTITYGSLLTTSTGITVQAEWGLGTIQGNGSPTEQILSYVVGSATDGYNGTQPVINTVDRTISWEITSIPGNTANQTVSFKLKTYDDYTGPLPISFSVNGRILGPGTQTADSTVTSSYLHSGNITPTPTPTCVPSQCPTPIPSATPTPTPVPAATRLDSIEVRTISSSNATVAVTSNNTSTVKVTYGTSKNNLNQSLSYLVPSKAHLISFEDLQPQQRYYFRITLTDTFKRTVTSDIFVFDTAAESVPPQVKLDSLIVTSSDVVLTDPLRNNNNVPTVILPHSTSYSFKFAVTNFEQIKSIQAILRDGNVLGLANYKAYASTNSLDITEISPGQYIGRLNSSPYGGSFDLILQISDYSGNISEQTAAIIQSVSSLKVVDKTTKQGIENAKITVSYYNQRLKTYELLSSSITPIKNPSLTEPDGTANIVLPNGKYRAEIEVLGYETKTVEFEIGPNGKGYPTVELIRLPFSLTTYLQYSLATFLDFTSLLKEYLHTLRSSIRFFDFVAFAGGAIMTVLLLISASRRTSVPIRHLPYFFLYHILSSFKKPTDNFLIRGKVTVEGTDNVISDAIVYVTLPHGKVLSRVTTNVDGEFFAKITTEVPVVILVSKKGFKTVRMPIQKTDINENHSIALTARMRPRGISLSTVFWYVSFVAGSLFETILILTIIIEALFMLEFGFLKVAPFLTLSLFNLLLWAFHVRHTKSA